MSKSTTTEKKWLTAADIPERTMADIRDAFERDPKVRELRTRENLLRRQGRYSEALRAAKDTDYLFARVVQAYVDETERECSQVSLGDSGIPAADIDGILERVICLFMACDVIETAIMDVNDLLRKTDSGLQFEMFDDLRRLSDMVREKIRYMKDNSGYGKDVAWADKCDNMYGMMLSKARAVIRRRKEKGGRP